MFANPFLFVYYGVGLYINICALIDCVEIVVVGLYLPPTASIRLLYTLVANLAIYSTDNIIFMDDINMVPDPEMDRISSVGAADSDLSV